jgi:hypothetical protein
MAPRQLNPRFVVPAPTPQQPPKPPRTVIITPKPRNYVAVAPLPKVVKKSG